jgi:hypothetical protein
MSVGFSPTYSAAKAGKHFASFIRSLKPTAIQISDWPSCQKLALKFEFPYNREVQSIALNETLPYLPTGLLR